MREMGLHQLADWFAEALLIYCRRRTNLSEEEFAGLEPFALDEADARRFGEIGELFISDDSELFKFAAPIKDYATMHREEFT
jgi:hypothetical protein